MRTRTPNQLTTIAAVGLIMASATTLFANDQQAAGFARVSDFSSKSASSDNVHPTSFDTEAQKVQTTSHCDKCESCDGCDSCDSCDDCDKSCCLKRGCFCKGCISWRHHNASPLGIGLHCPGAGFNPPAKNPIRQVPVTMSRGWPSRWYGEAGSAPTRAMQTFPTVAVPTDTTQLGYYYQRVPQWQANPGMLPPAPYPPNFHDRTCPYDVQYGGLHHVYPGKVIHSDPTPVYAEPTPQNQLTPAPDPVLLDRSAMLWRLQPIGARR